MSILRDFEKTSPGRIVDLILTVVAIILPGVGFMYFFRFEIFLKLELLKLIIVSLIYSAPLFIINLLMAMEVLHPNLVVKYKDVKDKEKIIQSEFLYGASVYTIFIFSFALVIGGLISFVYDRFIGEITLFIAYTISITFLISSYKKNRRLEKGV